jgi:hypothetical protein
MAAPLGVAVTNSGGSCFVYNNLQASVFGTVAGNTNSVGLLPLVQGMEPQSAQFVTARQPGGSAYRQPTNANFPNTTNPVVMLGGDLGLAAARMGFTKGGAFLVASNSNGTSAVTADLTNTQVNTNGFWGDTTFTNANIVIFHNLSGIDGVSNGNGSWYVNGSATNGAVLNLNTNGTYVVKPNGGVAMISDPNGFAIAAATCKVLCTPVNGGVLGVVVYGS